MRIAQQAKAAVCAGFVAGVVSTLVQVILWAVFTDALPGILYRDARLAAALVLGASVLPPPATFEPRVMLVATALHFALSVVYAAILAAGVERLRGRYALTAGTLFGVALYALNLHALTAVFPWFAAARGAIALAAHVAFGASAAATYAQLRAR